MNKKIYNKILDLIKKDRNCSISYIQRTLGIGYSIAAHIVEELEKNNVVSSANSNGKREVTSWWLNQNEFDYNHKMRSLK